MAVLLRCPRGHRLKVPSKFAGRRIACPVCDAKIDVPDEPTAKPPRTKEPSRPQETSVEARKSEASEHRDSSRGPASAEVPEFSIRPIDNRFSHIASAPSRGHQTQCVALAVASLGVAAVCLFPSLLEQTMSRQIGLRAPDAWSYWVILLCVVQIGLSLLAVRIPDWSTTWLLTLTATGVSAVYAAGLALTMFANQDHALLRRLGLLDEVVRTRAQPWCFFIVCLGLILAYASGRCSVAWHHQEQSRLQP